MIIHTTTTRIGRTEYIAIAVRDGGKLRPKHFGLQQALKAAAAMGDGWNAYGRWPYYVARPI
jgi:hypothetical protein